MNVRSAVLTTPDIWRLAVMYNFTDVSEVDYVEEASICSLTQHTVMCPTETSGNLLQTTRRRAPGDSSLYFRTVHNGSCRGHKTWGDWEISIWAHISQGIDRIQACKTAEGWIICLLDTEFPLHFTFWEDNRGHQRLSAKFDTLSLRNFYVIFRTVT